MQTSEFITYMSQRLNADLTREQILDMTNKAQNEILAHDNRITRIVPDPNVHTGSEDMNGIASNIIGNITFDVAATIPNVVATKGFLQIQDDGGVLDKLEYQSFSGVQFILADDVALDKNYTANAVVNVDQFDILASGALFSSVANERNIVQWDVRRVSRVYAYSDNAPGQPFFNSGYGSYGSGGSSGSRNPNFTNNFNGNQLEISCDTSESKEPLTGDCSIVIWQDNSAPTNPSEEVYFARAQRWPEQLVAETVKIDLPDRFHTNLLRFAILKDEEYREYGRDDNPQARYEQFLSEFLTWAEVGAQSTTKTHSTPRF